MMQLRDIKPGDVLWSEVWALYEGSFPTKERRSENNHTLTLEDVEFNTKIAEDSDGKLLGFLFYWNNADYLYVEHLAVSPALRGRNIGSRILTALIEQNKGRRIILEIDPPEDEISIRRLHFYERLGFVSNDCSFVHPGFGNPTVAEPHRLVMMSYPGTISDEQFAAFIKYVYDRVLRVK